MKSACNRFFCAKTLFGSILFFGLIAYAKIPEKMRSISKTAPISHEEQGGILFSADVNGLHATDLDPTITISKINSPYKVYTRRLLSNGQHGLNFMVLPVGRYVIDGLISNNSELTYRSQNKLAANFEVKPNTISYLGKFNITLAENLEFLFTVNDAFEADIALFNKEKSENYDFEHSVIKFKASRFANSWGAGYANS